jgi:16S rRNA (cytosine967-C5)-methyltransferase
MPPGFPARRAALRLLDAVVRRGEALDQAASAATRDVPRPEDKALALAIAAEVLRWSVDLDLLIDSATRLQLAPDAKARMVLRIALVQALAMGTPAHAAIATALPLVDGGPRKLVHGVFGTLSRSEATLPPAPTLPADIAMRWAEAWGADMVAAAQSAWAAAPPLDLTIKNPDETDAWAEKLGGHSLMPGHVRLPRGQAVQNIAGYGDGAWWVQDIAASIAARLLGPGDGRSVIDLGAAPGGKTMQLAAAGWTVTAVDQSAKRMERVAENMARVGLVADRITANALNWSPDALCDAVLLDAPCSATGIFRRHPDVLHRVTRDMIAVQTGIQAQMLASAAQWIKPGGKLVYTTCSLEPVEGEEQVMAFLDRHTDFAIAPISPDVLPVGIAPDSSGILRILPGAVADHGGNDGFFIAILRHKG